VQLHNAAGKLAGEVLNQDGQTALHIACSRYGEEADPSLVKYLLKQKGANPSARDNRQWTPLHCVCQASASASIVNALGSCHTTHTTRTTHHHPPPHTTPMTRTVCG
jgi:hypothetical protein